MRNPSVNAHTPRITFLYPLTLNTVMKAISRPRGTRDFLPADMEKRRWLENIMIGASRRFGYGEIATPVFEQTELFTRKSGEEVLAQIYTFQDKGGRSLTLRPELTAAVLRAYSESLAMEPKPVKLYYFGNCFRYERPQKGRYREFWQFGVEIIGTERPVACAELVALADAIFKDAGLENYKIRIGHIGILRALLTLMGLDTEHRAEYMPMIDKKNWDGLRNYLAGRGIDGGAFLDIVESPSEEMESRTGDALERSTEGAAAFGHLKETMDFLRGMGVDVIFDPTIARGLDYYTGMVFEVDVPDLGAEKQICGGGAYQLDELFGVDTGGSIGFALGFDRMLLALEKQGRAVDAPPVDIFVIPVGDTAGDALGIAAALRRAGLRTDMDLIGRKIGKLMKTLSAKGIRFAVFVGEDELTRGVVNLKNLETREQEVVPIEGLVDRMREII